MEAKTAQQKDRPGSQQRPEAAESFRASGMVTHPILDMQIDEKSMYIAPLVICTGSEDRDGETTDPNGILDVEYRKNPVVFFNHSHKFDPSIPPIGTAETPDRKYDCRKGQDGWYSGCKFSQASKLGEQIFALVVDGVIRGRSIGGLTHDMAPYNPKAPGVAFHKGNIVPVRTKSVTRTLIEMIEWSWCPIQSNRDVVTMVKSVLSRDSIDGRKIDGSLRRLLSSVDLREPASSARHTPQRPHVLRSSLFGKGNTMAHPPVAVRFDTKLYSVADAKKTLAEMDLIDTPLEAEERNGHLFLRSTQAIWNGPVVVDRSDEVPGIELIFVKGKFFSKDDAAEDVEKPEPTEADADDEGDIVDRIVEEVQGGGLEIDEAGDQAKKPAAETPKEVAVPTAKEKPAGPIGKQYFAAMLKYLTEGVEMAEAGMAELEPELVSKCGEFLETMRAFAGKVNEFASERYGKPDGKEADPDAAEKEEETEEEPDPHMTKALRADLWFGRRERVPARFLQAVEEAAQQVDQDAAAAKNQLHAVCKSFVSQDPAEFVSRINRPDPADQKKMELIQQELMRRRIERIRRHRV